MGIKLEEAKGQTLTRKNIGILSNRRNELSSPTIRNVDDEIRKNKEKIDNLLQEINLKVRGVTGQPIVEAEAEESGLSDEEKEETITKQTDEIERLTKTALAMSYYTSTIAKITPSIYTALIDIEIFKAVSLTINSDLLEDIKLKNSCRIPRTVGALNALINNMYDDPEIVDKLIESYERANDLCLQKITTYQEILKSMLPDSSNDANMEDATLSTPTTPRPKRQREEEEEEGEGDESKAKKNKKDPEQETAPGSRKGEEEVSVEEEGEGEEEEEGKGEEEGEGNRKRRREEDDVLASSAKRSKVDSMLTKAELETIITQYELYIEHIKKNKDKLSDEIMKIVDSYLQAEIRKSARGSRGTSTVSYSDNTADQERLEALMTQIEAATAGIRAQQEERERQEAVQAEQTSAASIGKKSSKGAVKKIFSLFKKQFNVITKNIENAGKTIQKLTKTKQDLEIKLASKTKVFGLTTYQTLVQTLSNRVVKSFVPGRGGNLRKNKTRKNKRKKYITKRQRKNNKKSIRKNRKHNKKHITKHKR
jgi:hypothetical protein